MEQLIWRVGGAIGLLLLTGTFGFSWDAWNISKTSTSLIALHDQRISGIERTRFTPTDAANLRAQEREWVLTQLAKLPPKELLERLDRMEKRLMTAVDKLDDRMRKLEAK